MISLEIPDWVPYIFWALLNWFLNGILIPLFAWSILIAPILLVVWMLKEIFA